MISQAQKIDCRAFVGEIYFRFFRNRLIQQNQISRLTPKIVLRPNFGFFLQYSDLKSISWLGPTRRG